MSEKMADGAAESGAAVEMEAAAGTQEPSVDLTLVEWMLDRTPEQRLEALQGFVDSVWSCGVDARPELAAILEVPIY
jgi:hypothetical protein